MLNEQHEERVECDMVHPQASMLIFKKKILKKNRCSIQSSTKLRCDGIWTKSYM